LVQAGLFYAASSLVLLGSSFFDFGSRFGFDSVGLVGGQRFVGGGVNGFLKQQ
jgi:hypothetical protein